MIRSSEPARRAVRVALFADGVGGINGIHEVYARVLEALPQSVAVTVMTCERSGLPGELRLRPALRGRFRPVPEVSHFIPRFADVRSALDRVQPDIVHVAAPGPLGISGLRVARERQLPVLASFHTDLASYAGSWLRTGYASSLIGRLNALFFERATLITAPTAAAARSLQRYLALGAPRVRIVPQGVDLDRFRMRADCTDTNTVKLVTVSRLSREKHVDRVLAAFDRVAAPGRLSLTIVGRGPLAGRLSRQARADVAFAGCLTGSSLVEAYQRADIFVLASPGETCGQVLLEAQACGLPCVVSPSGAAREVITAERTGFVAADDSSEGFTAPIAFLATNPVARREMALAARARARQFSWSRTASALADCYFELCVRPRDRGTSRRCVPRVDHSLLAHQTS